MALAPISIERMKCRKLNSINASVLLASSSTMSIAPKFHCNNALRQFGSGRNEPLNWLRKNRMRKETSR
jgi:hypothetical protein